MSHRTFFNLIQDIKSIGYSMNTKKQKDEKQDLLKKRGFLILSRFESKYYIYIKNWKIICGIAG